jgi:integrase
MGKDRLPHVPKLCRRRDGRLYATDPHSRKPVYFKTPEEYEEWRATFLDRVRAQAEPAREPVPLLPGQRLTVAKLCAAYLDHARTWYRKEGKETSEIGILEMMTRRLIAVAGTKQVHRLRVADVEAFLTLCIEDGLVRRTINALLRRLKTMARWGVRKEVLPGEVLGRILSVPGLPAGRTAAREKPKVKPVPCEHVEKTLPHLRPVYRDMVRLELASGMRPGETCRLKAGEIDRTREPWEYVPGHYKTEHRHDEEEEKRRRIFFGPVARKILVPYLDAVLDPAAPLFRSRRGKPVNINIYHNAIKHAARKAGVPHWHPNQLRHAAGTAVRALYGIEGARNYLGHENLKTTEVYSERDQNQARKIAEDLG